MINPGIWIFHGSLTMDNGKLNEFNILEALCKMAYFELCFTCTDAKSRHLEFSQLTGFE